MDCGHFDLWACGNIKWKIYMHFEFLCVVFGKLDLDLDLDLDFKLINLKSRDFKSIDFGSYFKSKHFKGLKSWVNLSNLNP